MKITPIKIILSILDISVFILITSNFELIFNNPYALGLTLFSFWLFLYIFNFYSIYYRKPLQFVSHIIICLISFSVFYIIIQYTIFYQSLYGRKIFLTLDIILFFYLIIRCLIINYIASRIKNKIYLFLEDIHCNQSKDIREIILELKKIGSNYNFKGLITLNSNRFVDEDKKAVNTKNGYILVPFLSKSNKKLLNFLLKKKVRGAKILSVVSFFEIYQEKLPLYDVSDEWFIHNSGFEKIALNFYKRTKRLADLSLSSVGLVIALPLIVVIAIIIKLTSRGSVIFYQVRNGKNGKQFKIYKFRSMKINAEEDGARWADKNDSRTTFIGKIIRKSRLDELPQLINVLKGDMSFIGPRPERPEFDHRLEKEMPYYSLRYMVQPGITGWAQINYPYGASIEDSKQKLTYDLYYIKNYSPILDLRIFLKTIRTILFVPGR